MNMNILDLDIYDKYSIEKYARGMVGQTFAGICDDGLLTENLNSKGRLGIYIEKYYFHYEPNNNPGPDFEEAGVELKTTGYIINSKNQYRAKERLVLTMIDYMHVIYEPDFETSHLWYKTKWMLLVFYRYIKDVAYRDFSVDYVRLFTPSEQDLVIIREDYNKIVAKIKNGLAHELSEADTMYLSAATKSSDSSVRRQQPNSSVPAKPRAFAYKQSYMSYVFNTYVLGQKPMYESIVGKHVIDDFEMYVLTKLHRYQGMKVIDLCRRFGLDFLKQPKNLGAMLAYRMLEIKGNHAEEFVKAGVMIKTIHVNVEGKIKENMSFPVFRFTDIVEQDWEDSDFYNTLSSTKFLFIIFQKDKTSPIFFKKAMFWNIPSDVLENQVRHVWERTKDILLHIDQISELHNGITYNSIFPKQSENPVSHVRPHARDSKDTYPLPDGRAYPKQCFWLNNSYLLSVIKDN